MMADESDDCRDVVRYWNLLNQGWDAVFGSRFMKGGGVIDYPWVKLWVNRLANLFIRLLFRIPANDITNAFKAYRREILEQVPLYGELHRFIPALASWHGASIVEVPIRNGNRERGVSHYGISRTFRVFFDLITIRFLLKYLGRPLHFFGTVGMLGIFGGMGITAWLFLEKFVRHSSIMAQHGPLMIFAAVLLLAGLNLLAIGLLGELQVRHYHEPTRRAPYSVDRIIRAHSEQQSVPE